MIAPRWVLLGVAAAASFSLMAACVRAASHALPFWEVVFFRNAIALLLLAPLIWRARRKLLSPRWGWHLARSLAGLAAMACYFWALKTLPLADAMLLNYTSPLFVAIFALGLLGEHLNRARVLALALGLVGVALVFHPSSAAASWHGLVGLASGVLAGLALALVRKLAKQEEPIVIVAWFTLTAALGSLLPALTDFRAPALASLPWVLGLGLFGSLGQLAMTKAYELAPAARVSPLGYLSVVFAMLLGWGIWDEVPSLWGLAGGALIVLAGAIVAREEGPPSPPSATPAARI